MRAIAVVSLALLLAGAAACAGGGSPLDVARDAAAPMQTELLRYTLDGKSPARADLAIAFSYRNPSADTMYFVGCWRGVLPTLQKKQGSSWVDAVVVVTPPCLTVHQLPPQGVRPDTLPLCYPTSPTTSSCAPWKTEGVTGIYRLRATGAYYHYDGGVGGQPVPDALRTSNEFVLELK